MTMGLEGRVLARRTAPFHVQLELTSVPAECPNQEVRIEARIVCVFRGEELLQPGSLLSFPLWVCNEGREPTGPAFVYHQALVTASYMEAYLDGTPPQYRVAAYEFTLLSEPSTLPIMRDDDDWVRTLRGEMPRVAVQPRNARWWEIWKR